MDKSSPTRLLGFRLVARVFPLVLLVVLVAVGLTLTAARPQLRLIDFQVLTDSQRACEWPPPWPVVSLEEDGYYTLRGQRLTGAELRRTLEAEYAHNPDRAAFVGAAPGRTYGDLVALADLARGSGAQVIGVLDGPRGRGCLALS
jgi:biopolymer transport protein ExbD